MARRAPYGVLIHWPETPFRDEWHEVVDGLTVAEAEAVGREQRRRGALSCSVTKAASLRKLAARFNVKAIAAEAERDRCRS